jgi:hypothetical protein
MSDYGTTYQVACTPGPRAAAGMTRLPTGAPVLVVYLDPVNMTIQSAPTGAGIRELADFCRELAQEASRLAATIDPDGEITPPENTAPRHALVRNEYGDSGAGN